MSDRVRIWGISGQPDVECVLSGAVSVPRPRQVAFSCKLVYFERGGRRFQVGGTQRTAQSGDLLLIPPGMVHEAGQTDECDSLRRILSLPENCLAPSAAQTARRPAHGSAGLFLSDPALTAAFRRLHRPPEAFATPLEQEVHFAALLDALLRTPADRERDAVLPAREDKAVRSVRHYIEDCYADAIPLARLTQIAPFAPAYLCRVFTQAVGMPPHAYQIAVRIAHACRLLRRGCSIGVAAQETGFYDQAHFTRHFSRLMQMPPSRYVREVKNVQDNAAA